MIIIPTLVLFLVTESILIYINYDRYLKLLPSIAFISSELSCNQYKVFSKLSGLKQDFIHGYYEVKHSKKRIYIKSAYHRAFVSLFIGIARYSKKGDKIKIDYNVKLRLAPMIFFLTIVVGLSIGFFFEPSFDDYFFLKNYFFFLPLIIGFLIFMYYGEFNIMKSSISYVIEEISLKFPEKQ